LTSSGFEKQPFPPFVQMHFPFFFPTLWTPRSPGNVVPCSFFLTPRLSVGACAFSLEEALSLGGGHSSSGPHAFDGAPFGGEWKVVQNFNRKHFPPPPWLLQPPPPPRRPDFGALRFLLRCFEVTITFCGVFWDAGFSFIIRATGHFPPHQSDCSFESSRGPGSPPPLVP